MDHVRVQRARPINRQRSASFADASPTLEDHQLMSEQSVFGDQLPARSRHVGKGTAKAKGSDGLPTRPRIRVAIRRRMPGSQVMVGPSHAPFSASSTWLVTSRDHLRTNQVASTGRWSTAAPQDHVDFGPPGFGTARGAVIRLQGACCRGPTAPTGVGDRWVCNRATNASNRSSVRIGSRTGSMGMNSSISPSRDR